MYGLLTRRLWDDPSSVSTALTHFPTLCSVGWIFHLCGILDLASPISFVQAVLFILVPHFFIPHGTQWMSPQLYAWARNTFSAVYTIELCFLVPKIVCKTKSFSFIQKLYSMCRGIHLKELHWLSVKFCCKYKSATLAYRHFKGSLPPYLSSSLSTYEPSRSLRSWKKSCLKSPSETWNLSGNILLVSWHSLFGTHYQPIS